MKVSQMNQEQKQIFSQGVWYGLVYAGLLYGLVKGILYFTSKIQIQWV